MEAIAGWLSGLLFYTAQNYLSREWCSSSQCGLYPSTFNEQSRQFLTDVRPSLIWANLSWVGTQRETTLSFVKIKLKFTRKIRKGSFFSRAQISPTFLHHSLRPSIFMGIWWGR